MSNIIDFPGTFKGIKDNQRGAEDADSVLKLYPTIDTLEFKDSDDMEMTEALIETKHIDITVIYDEEEDDYYIKAGHLLQYAETKAEANDILRDIMRSLKRI